MPGVPKAVSVWPSESPDRSHYAKRCRRVSVQRLITRRQFQAVLGGHRVATTAHFALHRCALGVTSTVCDLALAISESTVPLFTESDVWLGAMVPKRWAKRAVTRNTIKRQIHNVSLEFESLLPMAAYVVRLRSGFASADFRSANSEALKQAVRRELAQLLSTLSQSSVRSQ